MTTLENKNIERQSGLTIHIMLLPTYNNHK